MPSPVLGTIPSTPVLGYREVPGTPKPKVYGHPGASAAGDYMVMNPSTCCRPPYLHFSFLSSRPQKLCTRCSISSASEEPAERHRKPETTPKPAGGLARESEAQIPEDI